MRWLFGRFLKGSGIDCGTGISDGVALYVVRTEEDNVVVPE